MSNFTGHGMEAMAVRRTTYADGDKVRYRVYRTPTEFVAVIAESALMAVKVSGIDEPYRIMRDLPSEGVTVKSEQLTAMADQTVSFATSPKDRAQVFVSMNAEGEGAKPPPDFVALQLRDLQSKGRKLNILSAEAMSDMMGITPTVKQTAAVQKPAPAPLPLKKAIQPSEMPDEVVLTPEEVQTLLGE